MIFRYMHAGEGELTVSLGIVIDEHKASFEVEPFNEAAAVIKCNSKDDWKKYSVTFTADEELESDGSGLIVTNTGDSDLDVDMVCLCRRIHTKDTACVRI